MYPQRNYSSHVPQGQPSEKPPQTVEKSLGYISWSLKEISESLKKISAMMEGKDLTPPPF